MPEVTRFNVRVIPNSSQTLLAGRVGDSFKIKLQAPPADGKANKALLKFLAKTLGVKPRQLNILHGETSQNKLISVDNLTQAEVDEKLNISA